MKRKQLLLILITIALFSCEKGSKSKPNTVDLKTLDSKKNVQSQKSNEKYIYNTYQYTDIADGLIKIQNSFPKSGINYTDSNGKKYVYAVFWTRIINETANTLELTIDFPSDSFELSSSPGNHMKLFLPSETMTHDKESLYNYGLDVKSLLDKGLDKSSSLKRTINPKEATVFYVVTLSLRGVNGTLRTGFSLKRKNLFYKINDKEIPCGRITLKTP